MGIVFSKEYEIHFYEVDGKLNCTMESIIKFIEDIGTDQSERLGGGIEYLTNKGLAWVFYQYDILVSRYPKYGEKIRVVTNPYSMNKFYAFRKYDMYDEEGNKIVEATAIFLLIDVNRRRLTRISEEIYTMYGTEKDSKEKISVEKLEPIKDSQYNECINVKYSDIDVNKHVNNIKYVQWAIDSIPMEILDKYELKKLKVSFEKECKYGEKLSVLTSIIEEDVKNIRTIHQIEDNGGKVKTKIVGIWKNKN